MNYLQPSGTNAGDRFAAYYARSWWRLGLLLVVGVLTIFGPLYVLRGMRLVQLGAVGFVAVACAAVALTRPFEAAVLGMFIGFSGLDAYVPGPAGAGLLLLSGARIGLDALDGKPVHWGSGAFRFLLAVLLVAALTSLHGVREMQYVFAEVRNMALGFGAYLTVAHFADRPRRVAVVMAALALALTVASAVPLLALVTGGGLSVINIALAGRIGGLGTDANMHAGDVNAVIPLLIASALTLRGWIRWVLWLSVPVLVASVIASQSRAGVLLLAIMSLVLFLRAGRVARRVAFVALLALGVVALSLPRNYWVRFESLGQFRGIVVDRSLLLRQAEGRAAMKVFQDHPLFGVGLGNHRMHAPRHMLGAWKAHNSYLEVASSMGIVGLAAYLAWLLTGAHMAWDAARRWRQGRGSPDRRLADAALIGLAVFCATELTLSMEFAPTLWTLLGIAAAVYRCAPQTPVPAS